MALFGNTSVDAIVSTFTKTIDKLEAHAATQAAEIAKHDAAITAATVAKNAAAAENAKALSVAAKIKSLLS